MGGIQLEVRKDVYIRDSIVVVFNLIFIICILIRLPLTRILDCLVIFMKGTEL